MAGLARTIKKNKKKQLLCIGVRCLFFNDRSYFIHLFINVTIGKVYCYHDNFITRVMTSSRYASHSGISLKLLTSHPDQFFLFDLFGNRFFRFDVNFYCSY